MKKPKLVWPYSLSLAICASSLGLYGCSSRPDEAQMRQLSDLKQEVASLQSTLTSRESQLSTLEKQVAEKNAALKKCHDDQQAVKSRIAR